MSARDDAMRLPCGRDLLDLVAQVSDRVATADAAHQADCEFCQEALCRLRTSDSQLRAMAGEQVTTPHGLARRVMAQLRRERGRVVLADGPGGADTASDLVVLQIVRRAARSVDGVLQCSVDVAPATADGELSLTIHVTAELGPELPQLAEDVRRAAAADMAALTGLRTGRIAVRIDDVDASS